MVGRPVTAPGPSVRSRVPPGEIGTSGASGEAPAGGADGRVPIEVWVTVTVTFVFWIWLNQATYSFTIWWRRTKLPLEFGGTTRTFKVTEAPGATSLGSTNR